MMKEESVMSLDIIAYSTNSAGVCSGASITKLEGNILVHEGSKKFIEATLSDIPDEANLMLIERNERPKNASGKWYIENGMIKVIHADGSKEQFRNTGIPREE